MNVELPNRDTYTLFLPGHGAGVHNLKDLVIDRNDRSVDGLMLSST